MPTNVGPKPSISLSQSKAVPRETLGDDAASDTSVVKIVAEKVGDFLTKTSGTATASTFTQTTRQGGGSSHVDGFAKARAQGDMKRLTAETLAIGSTVTGLARLAVDGTETVVKALRGSESFHSLSQNTRMLDMGVSGVIAAVHLPGKAVDQFKALNAALKDSSRQNVDLLIDKTVSLGNSIAGTTSLVSDAVWTVNNRVIPYNKVVEAISSTARGLSPSEVRMVAREALTHVSRGKAGTVAYRAVAEEALTAAQSARGAAFTRVAGNLIGPAFTALQAVETIQVHRNEKSSDDEKYFSKLKLAGSALASTGATLGLATAAATALGAGAAVTAAVAAAPVILAAASVVGAGVWAYGFFGGNSARAEREAGEKRAAKQPAEKQPSEAKPVEAKPVST